MKKLLALVLAMCLLLPSYALAQEEKEKPIVSPYEAYTLEGTNACFCPEERGSLVRAVKPGSAVIFPIENAERAEDIKNMKLFTVRWEMGEEFTSRPYIEYRMLYDETGNVEKGYSYVAVVPVLYLAGEQKANVRGAVTLGPHSSGNYKRRFSFVVRDDGTNPYSDSYLCDGKDFPVTFDSSIHQVSMLFEDKALFMVDAFKQGPINAGFTSEPYGDILYGYPGYDLEFLRFTYNPVFDKVGELQFFCPKGRHIYEITPSGLKELILPYNENEEAYVLETRRLGDYVISKTKLPPKMAEPKVYNPPTGA